MRITRQKVMKRLNSYLDGDTPLSELVDWAEQAMNEGKFDSKDHEIIREVVSKLGVADVKAFGIEWEDFKHLLNVLGYRVKVEVEPSPK